MDEMTFLEYPLNNIIYQPKRYFQKSSEPLRILVTEAGSQSAYNLIYKICDGSVFGPNQEIILHLINARGALHHKKIVLELLECGFPCFKDYVLSGSPAVAFKNVRIVIAITSFQEISGFMVTGAILYQINKVIHLVRNIQDYATKDCKIIFTGAATKAMTVMLSALHKVFPNLNTANISCVTHLDTVISKAVLAAKLKITTDRIKNVIIWSATYPDVRNATIHMYPPEDKGANKKKDIPISDVLQDEEWLFTTFGQAIYRRVLSRDLVLFGKATAMATVHHLRVLFKGSDNFEEIHSMAVITPPNRPYGLPEGIGLSYPVKTENGSWKILENIPSSVPAQLNMMRILLDSDEEKVKNALIKVLNYMSEYSLSEMQITHGIPTDLVHKLKEIRKWTARYYVIPNPAENVEMEKSKNSRKSIAWSSALSVVKRNPSHVKSSIIFETTGTKEGQADSNSVEFSVDSENLFLGSNKNRSITKEKNRKGKF